MVKEAMKGVDIVYHLAALIGIPFVTILPIHMWILTLRNFNVLQAVEIEYRAHSGTNI